VPLGYRTDRLTKQLVIDERAAVAVRWFFDEAANGTTTNDLVAKANKKKLAGKQWTARTVLRLLTNPTYAGPPTRWRARRARADRRAGVVRASARAHRGSPHAHTDQAQRARVR
jgi:hypothetical protein